MANDGRLVEHTSEEVKVLGYRYNVQQDSLNIAQCSGMTSFTVLDYLTIMLSSASTR